MSADIYTYDNTVVPIDRIEFTVLGNDEIQKMSVIKEPQGISKTETYNNFEPVIGGLNDKRLGITDLRLECSTCGFNSNKCPGHFGHIELMERVYHTGYIQHIKKILNCICTKCSKLLINKNEDLIQAVLKNKSGKARFNEIRALCKTATYCQKPNYGCGAPVPAIKIETKNIMKIITAEITINNTDVQAGKIVDKKKKVKTIITPEICYNIFKNMSDTDCEIIGLDPLKTRPEMMIIKYFLVPPVQIRPTAKADFLTMSNYEDDLTMKLADIITTNTRIRKSKEKEGTIGKSNLYGLENVYLLQYHVATFFDNDSVTLLKSEQRNGHPIKSISSRIESKTGRIRGNLMGKRVDFCARTVIGPDPNLEINELGVPLKIAMDLTFPEVVTPYNIDKLTGLVRNGRDVYPGAKFIFLKAASNEKQSGIDLRYRKKDIVLKYGDIVERHLINGDIVLFNRQPSLHKLSMMAHKIRIINDISLSTFKLNLAVTKPYNADFDGDEMNMFVPQSIQTQIELDLIANINRQIISPGTSRPIIVCTQDGPVGAYLMTDDAMIINKFDAMNLIMYTSKGLHASIDKDISGKDLLSKIIPKRINISTKTKIVNGVIKEGRIAKDMIGATKNNIIQHIWNEYGMSYTQKFIDDMQRIVNNWLIYNGLTIKITDVVVGPVVTDQIKFLIESKKLEISHLITEMENNPKIMTSDEFEISITGDLNAIGNTIYELIYENLDDSNDIYALCISGSRGSKINIGQIIGTVGQQNVEGQRIKKRINNRTLCHFYQNDDSPLARGFCTNSFSSGLTPIEFYFACMTGRESDIDTAIKTADTGYIQRRLIKALEDISVKYDGTVRNSKNTIMQFLYGNNSVNTTSQIELKINIITMNNSEIEKAYKFTDKELAEINKKNKNKLSEQDNDAHYKHIIAMRDELRAIQRIATLDYITLNDKFMVAVDLNRIITNVMNDELEHKDGEKLEPHYILEQIKYLLQSNVTRTICMSNNNRMDEDYLKNRDERDCKKLFEISLYDYLSPRKCIYEYGLNKQQFDIIMRKIIYDYKEAKVQPGEMVGVVAAQSIGEPATQMSIAYETDIQVNYNGDIYIGTIGEFIDKYILDNKNLVVDLGNNSIEAIVHGDMRIMSVSEDGDAEWSKISHVSRHPANGNVIKVGTRSGRHIVATKSHSFLRLNKVLNKIEPIKGSELLVGDKIPVNRYIKNEYTNYGLSDLFGWFLGVYCAKGYILDGKIHLISGINCTDKLEKFLDEFSIVQHSECVFEPMEQMVAHLLKHCGNNHLTGKFPSYVFETTLKFKANLIKGYVDNFGYKSYTRRMIESLGLLLNYFGIYCTYEQCDELFVLNLDEHNAMLYEQMINRYIFKYEFDDNVIWDEIVSIDENEYNNYVYDFTVPINQTFMVLNGIFVHNTLNTFHFAGVGAKGTGIMGVPRLHELLRLSKTSKVQRMTIYLDEQIMHNKTIASKLASHMEYTIMNNFAKTVEIYYDPEPFNASFRTRDNVINEFKIVDTSNYKKIYQNDVSHLPWLFRIVLNKEKMFEKNINLLDIKSKFVNYIFNKISDTKNIKKDEKILIEKIGQFNIASNYDNNQEQIIHIRMDVNNVDFNALVEFKNLILNKFILKGIPDIVSIADISEERIITFNKDGSSEIKNQHVIYTNGINLIDIRYLHGIDLAKTITSDVVKIYKFFGIEAAKSALIKEIRLVIENSSNFANYQHIELMVDYMTNTGSLISIDRHGIIRLDTDPLSRASFEKTVDQLMNAAVFGEVDTMQSVSSRIMVGNTFKGGTCLCDVLMDTELLENGEYVDEYDAFISSNFKEITINKVIHEKYELDDFSSYMPLT